MGTTPLTPKPFLGGRDLVASALAGDFSPELGEGQQHVKSQGDAVGVKQLHELGEVGDRPGQAIDLVDDHNIDPALPDVCEQLLQAGTVQAAAREAAVIIMISDQLPAFVSLTLDVGLRGLPLSMKGVIPTPVD
jgi:hypothetical protein